MRKALCNPLARIFVLRKQKSGPMAVPGAAWQGLRPTVPNPSAGDCCPHPCVAAASVPVYHQIEFLKAFFFFFLFFFPFFLSEP